MLSIGSQTIKIFVQHFQLVQPSHRKLNFPPDTVRHSSWLRKHTSSSGGRCLTYTLKYSPENLESWHKFPNKTFQWFLGNWVSIVGMRCLQKPDRSADYKMPVTSLPKNSPQKCFCSNQSQSFFHKTLDWYIPDTTFFDVSVIEKWKMIFCSRPRTPARRTSQFTWLFIIS